MVTKKDNIQWKYEYPSWMVEDYRHMKEGPKKEVFALFNFASQRNRSASTSAKGHHKVDVKAKRRATVNLKSHKIESEMISREKSLKDKI